MLVFTHDQSLRLLRLEDWIYMRGVCVCVCVLPRDAYVASVLIKYAPVCTGLICWRAKALRTALGTHRSLS
eukprot:1159433-Pelagomonas_calceolata.AAC.7